MELRHLRYFIAVAKHLNFTRAAAELQTAQPSLSRQIVELEVELKMKLFERTHRYVALTLDGAMLLSEATEIVQRADALATLSASVSSPRGPLRIACNTAATIAVLPQVLPSYRAEFPNVKVSVETWTVEENMRALAERRVDVAFVRGPIHDPRCDSALVAEEQIGIAVPVAHALATRRRIAFRELKGVDRVGLRNEYTGGFNEQVDLLLRSFKIAEPDLLQTGNVETMLGLVASGMGVAVVSATLQFMQMRGVVLLPAEPETILTSLCLAWRRDRADFAVIRSLREHVLAKKLSFRFSKRMTSSSGR